MAKKKRGKKKAAAKGATPEELAKVFVIDEEMARLAGRRAELSFERQHIINRACRMIDQYTGRRFYSSTAAETKIFDGPRWTRDVFLPVPGLSYWYGSQRWMPPRFAPPLMTPLPHLGHRGLVKAGLLGR